MSNWQVRLARKQQKMQNCGVRNGGRPLSSLFGISLLNHQIYLMPKVTLHCYSIYLFWVLVSGILNVFNSN